MKSHDARVMPADVAYQLQAKMHVGLRALVMAQWAGTVSWDVGDHVRFDPIDPVPPYYPPTMPFKNAQGVVTEVVKHHGGAQDWAIMKLGDGRQYVAPMCWLRSS